MSNSAYLDVIQTRMLQEDGTVQDCDVCLSLGDDFHTEEVESLLDSMPTEVTDDLRRDMIANCNTFCSGNGFEVLSNERGITVIGKHFERYQIMAIIEAARSMEDAVARTLSITIAKTGRE